VDTGLCNVTAQYGNNDILKWLMQQGIALTTETCITAAKYNQLATLQFLHAEGCVLDADLVSSAAANGSIDVLLWLGKQGVPMIAEACEYAARGDCLNHLQLLHADGWPWTERVCSVAASRDHFDLLRWAHEHGCPWYAETIARDVAESGSTEVMIWLQQQPGVLFGHKCMISAADNGHLNMCQYLFEQGCAWPADDGYKALTLSRDAGERGYVFELDDLLEINCPLDFDTLCVGAATYGNLDLLQYVHQLGHMVPDNLSDALRLADHFRHVATAKWLRQQGAPWPDVLGVPCRKCEGADPWSPDLIEWARSEGCTSPLDYDDLRYSDASDSESDDDDQ
jgi:hypothetical protein